MPSPILTTTAFDIVQGALRLIGQVDADQPVPATQMSDGLKDLNFMIKEWQAQDLHLWTKKEGILFLDVGKADYKLGPSGDEAGCLDDFISTTFTTDITSFDFQSGVSFDFQSGVSFDFNNDTVFVASTVGKEGADDILPSDPSESTAGWTVIAGTIGFSGTSLQVSNAAGVAGEVERTIVNLVVGRVYRVIVDYTAGLSLAATYSMKDGSTTLGSVSMGGTGTGKFDFTATQTSLTFEILNGDIFGTNDTLTDRIVILDTTTGDFIGFKLDDGTRQWSKIIEVLSATSLTITDVLGTTTLNNSVVCFPELIDRPLSILQARRKTIGQQDEIEGIPWSRQQYFAQPDKTSQGQMNNWYYSPQLVDGRFYIWQTASDVDQTVRFTFIRPIQVTTDSADNPDFPAEWFNVLKWNLASQIGYDYTTPTERLDRITLKAEKLLSESLGFDTEKSSLRIQPRQDRGG